MNSLAIILGGAAFGAGLCALLHILIVPGESTMAKKKRQPAPKPTPSPMTTVTNTGWTNIPTTSGGTIYYGGITTSSTLFSSSPPSSRPLPERTDDEPIGAFKMADLLWRPGKGVLLEPLGNQAPHAQIAKAACFASNGYYIMSPSGHTRVENKIHDSPDMDCYCGFYAMKTRDGARQQATDTEHVLLEVELGGRVIVADYGYRAQWQRILRIEVPGGCYFCGIQPTILAVADAGILTARCPEHVRAIDVCFPTEVVGLPLQFDLSYGPLHSNQRPYGS